MTEPSRTSAEASGPPTESHEPKGGAGNGRRRRPRARVRYRYLRRIFRRPGVRAIAAGLVAFILVVGFALALGPEYWRF
ncbi:MAG: hypothetical protein ACOC8K_03495 [Gemmatimonadota bacterium]